MNDQQQDDLLLTDAQLLARFEAADLPGTAWTHRAHVRVAWMYLDAHPFAEALEHMRRGIKALNASLGIEDGPGVGYDETTTHAFMHLILATMQAYAEARPAPTALDFCDVHRHMLQPTVLRLFYSPARRMHPKARSAFVPPDLAPLPAIDG